ncbi:MAG: hypothetical protein ACKO3S_07170 [bacterium]
MTRRPLALVLATLVVTGAVAAAWAAPGATRPAAPAKPAAAARPTTPSAPATTRSAGAPLVPERFTLVIGHRAFVDFRDRVEVALDEEFQVGDTDYSAKVVEFQPDFAMDLESRTVMSRSNEPRNPAARVLVWRNGAPNDTSWAFLKMPPHFGRRSMLAFQLKRVTFRNHAPVEADSAALAAPRSSANPHSGSPH